MTQADSFASSAFANLPVLRPVKFGSSSSQWPRSRQLREDRGLDLRIRPASKLRSGCSQICCAVSRETLEGIGRRHMLLKSVVAGITLSAGLSQSSASAESSLLNVSIAADDMALTTEDARRDLARKALLHAIASGVDSDIQRCMSELIPLDPSRGQGGTSPALDGTWRLIWSAKAEAFSPLLRLPVPLRPESYQLLGQPAKVEVGEGRVAQLLSGGILQSGQLWLSSGVKPAPDASNMLEIFPPFRFEFASRAGGPKSTLVEASSDAEFREVNLRTAEEQAAPKNRYLQQYVDISGERGDLRISTIVSGDPVIVGAMFIHMRI